MWTSVVLLKICLIINAISAVSAEKFAVTMDISWILSSFENMITSELNLTSPNDLHLVEAGKASEDVHLTVDQLIVKYGYPVFIYEVTTEDGYVLTLHRIPSSGPSVLLMHGILLSADDWVTPGPESGIGYLLAAQGFDVWLGNARGNKHSRRHVRLSLDSADYWDFSWDEMGRYDLPAIIDHILNVTQHSQLIYIGHSQGTTAFYVMASELPEYSEKISLMIAMAPVGAIPNVRSPLFLLLQYITNFQPPIFFALVRKLGFYEFYAPNGILRTVQNLICGNTELAKVICTNIVFLLSGFSYAHLNVTNLFIQYSHTPSGGSMKQIEHYAQTISSRRFRKFDYGPMKNIMVYGSKAPPGYNIGRINTPMAMIYAENDWLAAEPDVLNMRSRLNNVFDFYKVPDKTFNHIDFLHGKDIKTLIFPKLMELIKNHN